MYCKDFFADEIAAELKYARAYGLRQSDLWYTKTFERSTMVCPNTTTIELGGSRISLAASVLSCERSELYDDHEGLTPYSDRDCYSNTQTQQYVGEYDVRTMMISDSFNPYQYYDTGDVQTTTRFDGQFYIDTEGNYINSVQLKRD